MKITSFPLPALLVIGFTVAGLSVGAADLVVKNVAGEPISSIDAGETITPDPRFIGIRIENSGGAAVENLSTVVEGAAAADFSLIDLSSTTIAPSSFVTARIKFTPQALGQRTALLRISSAVPSLVETAVNLNGVGGMTYSPIVDDPSVIQSMGPGGSGSYEFGTMTLNFEPVDQTIVFGSFAGFSNVPQGGIVYGMYQGALYPYSATFLLGPPPARQQSVTLRMAFGMPFADFDAKLSSGNGTVAIQADGRLIVTGTFTSVDGKPCQRIVRLNADGSVDPSFVCSTDDVIASVSIEPTGRILIAGYFDRVNGVPMSSIARLLEDGSLDPSFNPAPGGAIRIIALPDGKSLCSGGVLRRLNPDGTLDPTFVPVVTNISSIYGVAVQKDGKVLAGVTELKRFNDDGSLDTTFLGATTGAVTAIAVQDDGKIIIGGHFSHVNGTARVRIARLNPDGTIDESFSVQNTPDDAVSCVAVLEDGGIMISGIFGQVAGEVRPGIARLRMDGSLDTGFAPFGNSSTIDGMAIGDDGSVFVNGNFSTMGNVTRMGFAKLMNWPGAAEFTIVEDTLRWRRTGSVPKLTSVVFEASTNSGATWTDLGAPEWIGDSWILNDVIVPADGFVRARGQAVLSNRGFGLIQETKLLGRPLTALEVWREQNFGSPLNESTGADSRDFDHDGHDNLIEYAFGLDPKVAAAAGLPSWQQGSSGYEMNFTKPAGIVGVIYGAEWSESLNEGDWHPAEDLGVGDLKSFRVPVSGQPKLFFRAKVSNP